MQEYPKFVVTGEVNPLTFEPLGRIVNSPEEEAALTPKAAKPTPGKPATKSEGKPEDKPAA